MLKNNKLMIKKTILGAAVTMSCMRAFAAGYTDGSVRKNDFNWMQMNSMQSVDAKVPYDTHSDACLGLEFDAHSGIIGLYGYVDFLDALDHEQGDRRSDDNFFAKISPHFSLDAIFNRDLSVGSFNELCIVMVNNVGNRELFEHYVGPGTDVKVPWFGLVGVNIYVRYVRENYSTDNEGKWDGYIFSTNWSAPFYTPVNGSYLNYQGYFDYQFVVDKIADQPLYDNNAIEWYNGIYWHSERYAAGHGLKCFRNMILVEDHGGAGHIIGLGHYFSLTYKF